MKLDHGPAAMCTVTKETSAGEGPRICEQSTIIRRKLNGTGIFA